MPSPSIELHCHTMFSPDGVGSPEQLVDIAAKNGVQTLAVTEHNTVASYERARARAEQHGITYHPGVEIDALYQGQNLHFLAFDFDPTDKPLLQLLENNFSVYEANFCHMHPALQEIFPAIPDIEDLRAFAGDKEPTHPAPIVSTYQWRAWMRTYHQEILNDPDYSKRFKQAMANRPKKRAAAKPTFAEARDAVHAAGGFILLAHIGKAGDLRSVEKHVKIDFLRHMLTEEGLDGFELYHPFNSDEHEVNQEHPFFADIAALGQELDCVMSGGSDCHNAANAPASRVIGSCGAPADLFDPSKALSKRR